MRSDFTDITIVLDRSGSMSTVRADTIGGFNTFLDAQKAVPGAAHLTLYQFDDVYEQVYSQPLDAAPHLTPQTFVPRGSTALLDAIGRAVNETGARLAAMPDHERPGKVVFVILTDGEENASREFTRPQVMGMIRHQADAYQWQFVFLGANQDAIQAGASIGIAPQSSMTYAANAVGTTAAFASTSDNLRAFRTGVTLNMAYTADDRKKQRKAGAAN